MRSAHYCRTKGDIFSRITAHLNLLVRLDHARDEPSPYMHFGIETFLHVCRSRAHEMRKFVMYSRGVFHELTMHCAQMSRLRIDHVVKEVERLLRVEVAYEEISRN